MTDPTPTPAAPDWRELLAIYVHAHRNGNAVPPHIDAQARAALAATPPAPPLEPRGCPTPGACSCPTTPSVPPELIRALEVAEAALADIGDADREPGDDQPWAEHRAALDLPKIRRALQAWREHATPPAPTREAAPVPPQGAEISDEELAEMAVAAGMDGMEGADDDGPRMYWEAWDYQLLTFARAVWARAQAALPATQPVPVSERPWERPGWLDAEGYCWVGFPSETEDFYTSRSNWLLTDPTSIDSRKCDDADSAVVLPHWALPVPAADQQEGRDDA